MTAALLHVPADDAGPARGPDDVNVVDDPAAAGPAGTGFLARLRHDASRGRGTPPTLKPFVGEKTVAWLAYPKGAKSGRP